MSTVKLSVLRGVGADGEVGTGINIVGEGVVNLGSDYVYTITNFDSFSSYSISSELLTVSMQDETIDVSVPSDLGGAEEASFTVVKNSTSRTFFLAVGQSGVAKPRITSPINGSTGQSSSLTIQANSFSTVPEGLDTREEAQWQVARDIDFTDIVNAIYNNSDSWNVSGLPIGTTLYTRVRYKGVSLGWSSWSTPVSFTTSQIAINTPVVSYSGDPTDVGETPTFTSSSFFTTPAGADSHLSSSWELSDADGVVWSVNRSMSNRTSITIPRGELEESKEYFIRVRYEGSNIGESMWSDKLTFNTSASFTPEEGQEGVPFGGGYYGGRIRVSGQVYAIVVGSKVVGGQAPTTLQYKTANTATPNTASRNDCVANMNGFIAAGISNFPAAKWCSEYRGGGFDDWLLPSLDVLEVLYRNFKPLTGSNYTAGSSNPSGSNGVNPNSVPVGAAYTASNPAQTSIAIFKSGGAESFDGSYYWTSTEYNASYAFYQSFSTSSNQGYQHFTHKTTSYSVRPVRLVPVS